MSSVIWYFTRTRSAISIIYGVLVQELFRWFFFLLTRRAEKGLSTISTNPRSPFNRSLFAFVTGFGYALTSSLVSYIALLVESIGPGVIMCPSCPQASLFFISAVTTTLFSLLHIVWMMNAFEGYVSWNTNKLVGALRILWVIGSHYGASYAVCIELSKICSSHTIVFNNHLYMHADSPEFIQHNLSRLCLLHCYLHWHTGHIHCTGAGHFEVSIPTFLPSSPSFIHYNHVLIILLLASFSLASAF